MLLIGMLLGTVRIPDVAALVCVFPSVRVNVVRLVESVGPLAPVNLVVSVILAT